MSQKISGVLSLILSRLTVFNISVGFLDAN